MFPLTAADAITLHHGRLPGNVFIADASLFPAALGRPPILTIMALAKRISKNFAGATKMKPAAARDRGRSTFYHFSV